MQRSIFPNLMIPFKISNKDSLLEKLSLRYKISCDSFQNLCLRLLLTTMCIYIASFLTHFFCQHKLSHVRYQKKITKKTD